MRNAARLGLLLLALMVLASSCSPRPAPAGTPPQFKTVAEIPMPPGPIAFLDGYALSPDGRWLAVVATNGGERHELWLYPAAGGAGRLVATVDKAQLEAGTLLVQPAGWTAANELVYARQGTQPDGPHSGQPGISVRVVDPAGGEAREAGWVPVQPDTYVNEIYPVTAGTTVFAYAGDELWRIAVDGGGAPDGGAQMLKKGLSPYDVPFYPAPSSDGVHLAYDCFGEGRMGVWVVPAGGGEATCVAPTGESLSFFPVWAPGGGHLAFYAAGKKGEGESLYDQYDLIPSEDAPLAVAAAIDIVAPDGTRAAHLTVPDHKLAHFRWSSDGTRLAFATVTEAAGADATQLSLVWHDLYVADLAGNVTKVTAIAPAGGAAGGGPSYVFPVHVSDDGQAVYYMSFDGSVFALWLARAGQEPQQVKPPSSGEFGFWPAFTAPTVGESIFLAGEDSKGRHLLEVWRGAAVPLASGGDGTFMAGVAGRRVAYTRDDPASGETTLVVLEFD